MGRSVHNLYDSYSININEAAAYCYNTCIVMYNKYYEVCYSCNIHIGAVGIVYRRGGRLYMDSGAARSVKYRGGRSNIYYEAARAVYICGG